MRLRQGFTLIELLVVIAIIAILAAILFPVFAKAREKARQSSCQSNHKQVMLACIQYAQDYDERVPGSWKGTAWGFATGYTWRLMTVPYIKNSQVHFCPSRSQDNTWDPSGGPYNQVEFEGRSGMGLSEIHWATTPTNIAQAPANQPLASIEFPAETIFLADRDANWAAQFSYQDDQHTFTSNLGGQARHNEGANYAFCDGHVKWQKYGGSVCNSLGGGRDNCVFSIQ